VLSWHHDS